MSSQATHLEYVGFWARLWAWVIDAMFIGIIAAAMLLVVYGERFLKNQGDFLGTAHVLISYGLPPLIVIALWIRTSTTPGKMVVGAKIVDAATGGEPTPLQFILRYVGYLVSAALLGIGYLWIGFDARKQSLHDKMAGTVVVRRKPVKAASVQFSDPAQHTVS